MFFYDFRRRRREIVSSIVEYNILCYFTRRSARDTRDRVDSTREKRGGLSYGFGYATDVRYTDDHCYVVRFCNILFVCFSSGRAKLRVEDTLLLLTTTYLRVRVMDYLVRMTTYLSGRLCVTGIL